MQRLSTQPLNQKDDSMRRIRGTRLATACAAPLLLVHAALAAPALNDPAGILKALETGDRDAVAAGLDATRANPIMRELTQALLDGRTERVPDIAARCRDGAFAAGVVATAVYCNTLDANIAFAQGNLPRWAQRLRWLREQGLPAVQKQLGKDSKATLNPAIGTIDFATVEALPAPAVRMLQQAATLKVTRLDVGRGWWPVVEIHVNGQPIRALVDTGFNQSLVLSAKTAQRLQAKPVATDVAISKPTTDSGKTPHSAVQLDSVAIGSWSAEHFGALVMPSLPHEGVDGLVGLSLLTRFQAVVLGDDRIDLYPQTSSPLCADGARLTFTANRNDGDLLTFPIDVNGQSRRTAFDTGLGALVDVFGEPPALPAADVGAAVPETVVGFAGKTETRRTAARAELAVAGTNLGKVEIGLYPSRVTEYPTWLGSRVLEGNRLTLDFRQGRACLARAGS